MGLFESHLNFSKIDKDITSVSFSVYKNKGVFALFLGSGFSRSAGIPTGKEIILELIKEIAVLKGEKDECESSPIDWFQN